MSGGWKPGDVAMVIPTRGESRVALCGTTEGEWVTAWGKYLPRDQGRFTLRPLVVIDPEDREQVGRLIKAVRAERYHDQSTEAMQAALRSLVTPPKPEEPTGLGAVVEDEGGNRWILRWQGHREPWVSAAHATRLPWSDITAVKVLSEGVTR